MGRAHQCTYLHPVSVLVGPTDDTVGCWIRWLDCFGKLAEEAVLTPVHPIGILTPTQLGHQPAPLPGPSGVFRPGSQGTCNSRGERSCGRLSRSSLNWENLPSLAWLHIPWGQGEQWRLHSANEAGGWEQGTRAVFHRRFYWPHGTQRGDNKIFLLFSSLFVISK